MHVIIQSRFVRALSSTGIGARLLVAAVLAAMAVTACDVHGVSSPGLLASITVTPNGTLAAATTEQMTAVGLDADGRVITITPVWSVVASGGTVNSSGMFTAGSSVGVFRNSIVASVGSISGSATVTVTAGAVASITVTPNPDTLAVGAKQLFAAVAKDAGGNIVPFTPTWSVVAGGGSIDSLGNFTAAGVAGIYANTVQASVSGIKAFATVTVTAGPLASITVSPNPDTLAVGGKQLFVAAGKDASGNPQVVAAVWTVVANGGTIDANGNFTAGATPGAFPNTVKATSGALSAAATVVVTGGSLASIVVTPNPASMTAGATQLFTAVGRDASNNIFVFTPVWSVINGGGTIDNTGLFTAGAVAGTFTNTVRATSGAISGLATVSVTAAGGGGSPSALGSAAVFGVLAGTGISCAISGTITGATGPSNIGSSPTLTITGFPPCTFSGSIPAPAVIALAKGDLTAAYLAAQGQVCNTVLTGTDLGFYDGSTPAKTLAPGTYCFSTSAALTGTMKLTGSAAAKWTFQIGSTLNANVGSSLILAGGAIPDNVTWAVGSSATILTNAAFQGNILAQTSITLQNGASLQGRALAQNGAVDMTAGAATIVKP